MIEKRVFNSKIHISLAVIFLGTVAKAQILKQEKDTLAEKNIDEVVIPYGKIKKSDYTGSISTILGNKINSRPITDVIEALQGQVPGIQNVLPSGNPGGSADIEIRGKGSINASNAPLVVLDGIPFYGSMTSISANDIESINVLKDATAGALYGSRGANGIIMITTKSGKKKGTVNFNISHGFSTSTIRQPKRITTDEYFQLYWEALRNGYTSSQITSKQAAQMATDNLVKSLGINPYGPGFEKPVGIDGKLVVGAKPLWDNNWIDTTERIGSRKQADIDMSGGNENNNYYFSLGYLDEVGYKIGYGYKRFNTRLKIDSKVKKWLNLGVNLMYTNSVQENYPMDGRSGQLDNSAGLDIPSFYPYFERNPDGSYKLDSTGEKIPDLGKYRPGGASPNINPLVTVPLDKSEVREDNFSGKGFLDFSILQGLKFSSTFSVDLQYYNWDKYLNPMLGEGRRIGGSIGRKIDKNMAYTTSNVLSFDTKTNSSSLTILAGQEFYKSEARETSGSRSQFSLPGFYEPDAAAVLGSFNGKSDKAAMLSFFGKAQYNLKDKYFISGSLRTDASSKFMTKNRWGTFWSLGAAWKLSNEMLVKNLKVFDELTIRASYGGQGNDRISSYPYQSLYRFINNLGEGGVKEYQLPNPDLKWETNLSLNVAVEIAILKNRIRANVEYFKRKSKNLLYEFPLPPSLGHNSYNANIGELQNKGIEFSLFTTPIKNQCFQWNFDINLSTLKNEITKLPGGPKTLYNDNILYEGGSLTAFNVPEWMGVDPNNGAPLWKYIYKDAGGNTIEGTTSEYNKATKQIYEPLRNRILGGFTTGFLYKNFDLSALFTFSIGGKVFDYPYMSTMHNGYNAGRAWSPEILDRWTPEHTHTNVPALSTIDNGWNDISSRFLYSTTHLKLRNLSIGYTLPIQYFSNLGLTKFRIYLQGENLFILSKNKGMNPELDGQGFTYSSMYPSTRIITFGLQVAF